MSAVSHPEVHSVDVFRPAGRQSAAAYLRQFAEMLDTQGPPYSASIERVAIELNSEIDSLKAEVTIRLIMRRDDV